MEGSLITLPVVLIFTCGPLTLALSSASPIVKIAEWLPSSQLVLLAEALERSYTTMDVIIPIASIIVWSLVTWIVAGFIYKREWSTNDHSFYVLFLYPNFSVAPTSNCCKWFSLVAILVA